MRRRDGASSWGIFRDTESTDQYIETFIVNSWAEHLRQHERSVNADRLLEEAVRGVTRDAPVIRHFLYASKEPVRGQRTMKTRSDLLSTPVRPRQK